MANRNKIFLVFILVALIQLFIPAQMIWNQELVISNGIEHKFKTTPIDPNDPFRGKYITLNFEEGTIAVGDPDDWPIGETVYATFDLDDDGFTNLKNVSKTIPESSDYLKTKILFHPHYKENSITVDLPFERFYMEESKAHDAELLTRESQIDTAQITYALVTVYNGDAVLKDVLIDGVPIKDLVKNQQGDK